MKPPTPLTPGAAAHPRPLRAGDTVALVACSGPVEPDRLEPGVSVLESWGLRVRVLPSVLAHHPELPYLAAGDTERARDFQTAWADPDVAAVLAARGGYGGHRMLDAVDWPTLRRATPRVFAGSSDATALHEAIATHLGVPTLLAPMPATTHFDPVAAEQLRTALFTPVTTPRPLVSSDAETLHGGRARGHTVGGNLSVLAAAVGTRECRPAGGGIALLEDVDEEPYRLDRLLTQLLRTGWFDDVAGIALGSWTGCGPTPAVRAVLRDRLSPLGVPLVWRLNFGHHAGAFTVPLGVEMELDADTGTLTVTG